MASDNIFNDILQDIKLLKIDLNEQVTISLQESARFAVSECKDLAPTNSGDLKLGYGHGQVFGSIGKKSIEIYNTMKYAINEEEGHRQFDRWVPGRWNNGIFIYDPDERETGMMLKRKWVKGSLRMTNAVKHQNDVKLPQMLDKRIGNAMLKRGFK